MGNLSKCWCCMLVPLFFFVQKNYGQTRLQKVQLETQKTIRKLTNKVTTDGIKDTIVTNNLNRLSANATTLFNKINSNPASGKDTGFVYALEQSHVALAELLGDWGSNDYAANRMQDVSIDYYIKTKAAPLAASSNITTNIKVIVITKLNDSEVGGYDVKCNYMWDSELKKAKIIFNNQTNNAVKYMAPGYYVFWIEKDGVIIKKKSKVEIGNLSEPEELILFNL